MYGATSILENNLGIVLTGYSFEHKHAVQSTNSKCVPLSHGSHCVLWQTLGSLKTRSISPPS